MPHRSQRHGGTEGHANLRPRRRRICSPYQTNPLDYSPLRVQWVGRDGATETVCETDPELKLGTRMKLDLLSPFIPEGLL
jgi:hypothetical protein